VFAAIVSDKPPNRASMNPFLALMRKKRRPT
jgi:hypothetical protein